MKVKPNRIRAWLFGARLEGLKRAYAAGRKSLDDERVRLESEWREIKERVDAGDLEMVVTDEDGHHVYDYGEHLGELDAEVEESLSHVRQAFVISLHHFWEREMNAFLKTKRYNQQKAFAALQAEDLNVEEVELDRLRLTCNVAKHSGGTSAAELYSRHPIMFKIDHTYDEPEYENLVVSDADLESFFMAVEKSGFNSKI